MSIGDVMSKTQYSFGNDHRVAADFNTGQSAAVDHEMKIDAAVAAHLDALMDDDVMRAIAELLELHERARETRRGRSGRGIFDDAQTGREHARAECELHIDAGVRENCGMIGR